MQKAKMMKGATTWGRPYIRLVCRDSGFGAGKDKQETPCSARG